MLAGEKKRLNVKDGTHHTLLVHGHDSDSDTVSLPPPPILLFKVFCPTISSWHIYSMKVTKPCDITGYCTQSVWLLSIIMGLEPNYPSNHPPS